MKNLSHHDRYEKAGTTTCLVLHCLHDAHIVSNCSCACPGFLCAFLRMLKYSYAVSLQRKSLMRDPTLAEVATHNASVSDDRFVSCPPNFSARRLLRCPCYMLESVYGQSGEMVVVPPLFWTQSMLHVTTTYQYTIEQQIFVHNMPSIEPTWGHCILWTMEPIPVSM
jgi:hypothetical protein